MQKPHRDFITRITNIEYCFLPVSSYDDLSPSETLPLNNIIHHITPKCHRVASQTGCCTLPIQKDEIPIIRIVVPIIINMNIREKLTCIGHFKYWLMTESLRNSAHATTALLSWHEQNTTAILLLNFKYKVKNFCKFSNIISMGLCKRDATPVR